MKEFLDESVFKRKCFWMSFSFRIWMKVHLTISLLSRNFTLQNWPETQLLVLGWTSVRCGGSGPQQRDKCPMSAKMVVKRWSEAGEVPSSGTSVRRDQAGGSPAELPGKGTGVGCATSLWWMSTSPWRAQSTLLLRQFAWEWYDGGLMVESSLFPR